MSRKALWIVVPVLLLIGLALAGLALRGQRATTPAESAATQQAPVKQSAAEPLAQQPFAQEPPVQENPALILVPLGDYRTGISGAAAAEIVAFDPATRRAFVTNAANNAVDILDMSNPGAPALLTSIDIAPYGDGPTSVDTHDGMVAIAVKGQKKTGNGQIVFADADGRVLAVIEAGVRPDMITFTPDGRKVITANEGEPNQEYDKDPEGSVTIVDLSGGVEALTQEAATQVDFRAFNDMELDPSIRIFGPGATVAQDLEPEYVAVTPDSKRAYVSLQENNALAVIDLDAGRATELIPLGFKDHSRPFVTGLRNFEFTDLPVIGTTPAGQEVRLGGFSGLIYEGIDEATKSLIFVTHSDRGPNAGPVDLNNDGVDERPFAVPAFSPHLVRFALDPATGVLTLLGEIALTRKDGNPLTGISNVGHLDGAAKGDEPPIDLRGRPLPLDPYGADLEGVVHAPDGSWWMGDEYRPSLFHFDSDGRLIERYVPEGTNQQGVEMGVEALPAVLAQRQDNRGFEAVVLEGSTLYAFMQSPVDNPASEKDASAKASNLVRVIAFDIDAAKTVGQYLYVLDGGEVDKLGDAIALGNGEFLVLERDDVIGPEAQKFVYRVSLDGATNLQEHADSLPVGVNQGLEIQSPEGLAAAGIRPMQKRLFVDLTAAGYDLVDKAEGLALVDANTLALINDDDFGLVGTFDPATAALDPNPNPLPSLLTLISLKSTALDTSDRDGGIHLTNPPVLGMFQPDAIAAYEAGGATYLVTANEGDSRVYDGYSEEVRVEDLVLDLRDFPDAGVLQREENLGRLLTTSATGNAGDDVDGDGLADRILAYGTRSISIWDAEGHLVWDSGDDLERILAGLLPDQFNSDDVNNSFDSRSDAKGPEPEGLALGEVDGRTYAFVSLERIGGVMVYDVTEPRGAHFVTYVTTRDFAGDVEAGTAGDVSPEGLRFVPAEESPTGTPLLLVAHEKSGSTRIFAIATTGITP